MIKLIASDLDGTLLQNGNTDVSEEALLLIEKLCKHGVLFAAASGRTYSSLKTLFAPVKDKIIYICENGSLVKYKDETIFKAYFEKDIARELVDDILSKDECEVLISGENTSYLIPKEESYVDHMQNHVKNHITIVKDLDEINEEILKISVYKKSGIDDVADGFDEKWNEKSSVTVSGVCWQDFVPMGINKGKALSMIQEKLKVEPDFTMCFGDNYNDIEMFEYAHFSYAMSSAKSEIRAKARYVAMSVESILYDVDKMINFNL